MARERCMLGGHLGGFGQGHIQRGGGHIALFYQPLNLCPMRNKPAIQRLPIWQRSFVGQKFFQKLLGGERGANAKFLIGAEQRGCANFAQIHPHRVAAFARLGFGLARFKVA